MNLVASKADRRYMAEQNKRYGARMEMLDRKLWPPGAEKKSERPILATWRSRDFLAVVYQEKEGIICLSVNRTQMKGTRWADGITWDELQRVKSECGFGHLDGIEMYPRDRDVVNVANIRHIFIFEKALVEFAWRKDVNPTL